MSDPLFDPEKPVSNDWVSFVPLETPDLPTLETSYLPSWAGDFAKALAEHTESPSELAIGMVLVSLAAAAARRLRVEVGPGYYEPCNLWTVVALAPGNRKSAVQSAATAPLVEWERAKIVELEPEIKRITSEYETLKARAKEKRARSVKENDERKARELAREAADIEEGLPDVPVLPQIWTSDSTPERLGSLMADHEGAMAWLSSEGGIFDLLQGRYSNGIPNLDLILKSHSADSERVDRTGRPPVILRYPRLSIGLSPQPEVLRGLAFKPGFRGRGLLARFLYLLPASPLGFRSLQTNPVSDAVAGEFHMGLKAMLDWAERVDDFGQQGQYSLRLSAEAKAEHQAFAKAIEVQMRPGGDLEHFTDWAGKAPGAAARIAGVLHGAKHAHGEPWKAEITVETMRDACDIMAVFSVHSRVAFGLMGSDPSIAAATAIWNWIDRSKCERFTIRDAFNSLRSTFPRVAKLKEALVVLVERGYVEVLDAPITGPGRPPSQLVIVRPELVAHWW